VRVSVVNTHIDRCGLRLRVHARPKYLRMAGRWQAIADVVNVARDKASGAYRVACGEDWISFAPRKRQGKLIEAVVSDWHFGDVLEVGSGYDDLVEYDIAHSSEVTPTGSGWRFAAVTDIEVGVFLTDWLATFGQRVRIDATSVSVDLSDHRGDPAGRVNLDPIIVDSGQVGGAGRASTTWSDTRNGAGVLSLMTPNALVHPNVGGGQMGCLRGACRFNTSAVPAAGSAVLKFTPTPGLAGPAIMPAERVHVCRPTISLYGQPPRYTIYTEVKAGYEAHPWGVMSQVGGEYVLDFTEHYEQTDEFDIGFAEAECDVANVAPTVPAGVQIEDAYLELTLPTKDGLCLLGAGS